MHHMRSTFGDRKRWTFGRAPARSLAAVEDFCARLEVLPYGAKAAQHYGSIRSALEKQGRPIGVNDLHIVPTRAVRG